MVSNKSYWVAPLHYKSIPRSFRSTSTSDAHTFCSRDRVEEELESDIIYHYLLESFRALYGKTVTPQWHYGDGPDHPPHELPYVYGRTEAG